MVELYTEGDNTVAIRTYTAAGFTRATADVQMARPSATADTAETVV